MAQPAPCSVSKNIPASPETVFALLADPARHPEIDGSGMLNEATSSDAIAAVGDVFTIKMHNDEMGEYEMMNHVVAFDPNRQIAWEPALFRASRPEDENDVGVRAGHCWSYTLEPDDSGGTLVTETFDCSQAPEWLQTAVKGGSRWEESMTTSLDNLHRLST
jgi:uncharacterized protein YndB with AHSA1/START domain